MPANKILAIALSVLITGCSAFDKADKPEPKKAVPMPPPAVTQAWLDVYEPKVREAIKGTHFEFERRENLLVVTAPVQGSFNPDRPHMMLPTTLGPLSRMAKLLESDETIGVLILGHADSSGEVKANRELSHQRARAFTSIFRLSGLKQNRLMVKGLGSDMPRAANDSQQGRSLNRRVEILLTSKDTLNALIAKYSQPAQATTVAAAKPATDKTAKAVAKADKPATQQ
ncbi:flagellar motor protein MotB [Pseudomonas sp. HMWF032]|uniref:OmpA family protein n=1 Tax=unclassified Pseudomonas TaxID=196821 RepID=UPI000D3B476D|nr:OmpA family protein [Pseudomonas sp. HMWF032]PTS82876.1 flagellar motor protein MotB [Pseudomonas sp. HMWF032]PTT83039.1 flagellar motor protein MotB [Pseudomonas sp. HMWF010]WAC43745.1 OmpA family protein [Pseudomonas sp. SL4(2022)]